MFGLDYLYNNIEIRISEVPLYTHSTRDKTAGPEGISFTKRFHRRSLLTKSILKVASSKNL